MPTPGNLDQQLELRDPSGSTVGFFLPDRLLRDLLAEREALRQQVAGLRQEVLALQAQVEKTVRERDEHHQALQLLCREMLAPITAEELAAMKRDGIPFEQVVAEVERIVSAAPSGA